MHVQCVCMKSCVHVLSQYMYVHTCITWLRVWDRPSNWVGVGSTSRTSLLNGVAGGVGRRKMRARGVSWWITCRRRGRTGGWVGMRVEYIW